jgi:hypothetical protein
MKIVAKMNGLGQGKSGILTVIAGMEVTLL